jgi:hypothetical protein
MRSHNESHDMNRSSIIILALLALAGCASIDNAGVDRYTVRSFKTEAGMPACCELDVKKSGKEYAGRRVQFQTDGAGAVLSIEEVDAKAVKGQALAVKAINILPTMGLGDILAPRGQ